MTHAAVSRGVPHRARRPAAGRGHRGARSRPSGLATGFPYGRYAYSAALGPTLLGVPFLVPLAWLMMAWPSWVLADRLTRRVGPRRRHGARVAVAAAVFAAWDVVLDPQLVQAGYWTLGASRARACPGIATVPLTNLAGWLLAGAGPHDRCSHLLVGPRSPARRPAHRRRALRCWRSAG